MHLSYNICFCLIQKLLRDIGFNVIVFESNYTVYNVHSAIVRGTCHMIVWHDVNWLRGVSELKYIHKCIAFEQY